MPVDERVARSVALEQAYVHDVYDQFYDNPKSKPWPKVEQFLQDLEPGSFVCDVGCGNGKYLNVNSSVFNIGGDKSTRLSDVAREKENEVMIIDNLALPFRDESLDAALSIAVVHHLATAERRICALRELARVLRIGGKLIISVWAMEQSHRKFESQDVLVPWHRPKHLSTPSLELTSTTTTSEDDCLAPYHAYNTQMSDSDSNRSIKINKGAMRKRGKNRHNKDRSMIDPHRNSSPSSSSLSSPNETCYSFVRRAIQKLAGGRRDGVHRPWFLDSWTHCSKESSQQHQQQRRRYDPDGCECCDCMENIHDLPIELRRIDDDDLLMPQQRRQTFPSSQLINDIDATNLKSKSMTNMKSVEVRSQSINSIPEIDVRLVVADDKELLSVEVAGEDADKDVIAAEVRIATRSINRRLVKQKKSICEDDDDEALDQPTDMNSLVNDLPDFRRVFNGRYNRGNVLKQRSLNEELMSTERLKEKEMVRQNIQKQASLNDDLIYQRHNHTFDSFKDSFFSVSTSKRFQLIKTGFTNKIKNSTTNIEKVTSTSLKNGFVKMFQNWKSSDLISPTIPENEEVDSSLQQKIVLSSTDDNNKTKDAAGVNNNSVVASMTGERRHSKEDGSDSSKDSSLQSDTSVDSEDSFASVIFVPKSDPMSPIPLSPGPTSPRIKNSTSCSVPNSPRIKQSSCPTSPRIKQMPLTVYPLTKQLSSPKPSTTNDLLAPTPSTTTKTTNNTTTSTASSIFDNNRDHLMITNSSNNNNKQETSTINNENNKKTLAQKYSVQQIPKFHKTQQPKSNSPPIIISPSTDKSPTSSSSSSSNNDAAAVTAAITTRNERLKKIKELLTQKPGFGVRSTTNRSNFPIVRHSSQANGAAIAKPLPKLLALELFNPETDDKDSDSSCVSSPDSVDSVISVQPTENQTTKNLIQNSKFKFPPTNKDSSMSLLEAAADVAKSLDEAVDKVIKLSPRSKRRLQTGEVLSIIQRQYSTTSSSSDTTPLLLDDGLMLENNGPATWNEECHKHLTDFADKLSEKLLQEIDNYQEKTKLNSSSSSVDNIDDPYINRLSEELDDLSKLSAEIQKQNEYLARLSASDSLFNKQCTKCRKIDCKCCYINNRTKTKHQNNRTDLFNNKKVPSSPSSSSVVVSSGGKTSNFLLEKSSTNDSLNSIVDKDAAATTTSGKLVDSSTSNDLEAPICKLSVSRTSIKMGASTDSCDSEKGSSTNSMLSSAATSINFGQSLESSGGDCTSDKYSGGDNTSHKDTNSISRCSDDGGGSTASLASCPEWKTFKTKMDNGDHRTSMKEGSCTSLGSASSASSSLRRRGGKVQHARTLLSDTSQDSLPSDGVGGEITYHRYYHVFREGELDQLIENYVENLHIISSYYDHASWCIIAEKVQVWTI